MAQATVELTMVDGVRVVVPDSLDLITPYVLREQQDFFEDELRFVRMLLESGRNVVDIGANYGVYTLAMAQKVGADGHVWSFEPTSGTAHYLAQGIAANRFQHVTLVQKAVSSQSGTAQISLQPQAELNSIVHGDAPAGATETVSLVTLDDCMTRFHWSDIELIKIDAEGEEENIVKGGRRFFTQLSPLVEYELRKDATHMNFGLIQAFSALGYTSYGLVPGLNLLVPFDARSPPDPYLLNLFCCKTDRADRLASRGILLRSRDIPESASQSDAQYHWRRTLANLPYAASLTAAWTSAEERGESDAVIQGLALYERSRDTSLPPAQRFIALRAAYGAFTAICQREPTRLRLVSLSRIAHDLGERAACVSALTRLLTYIHGAGVDPKEPFLAPIERFESIPCGDPVTWLVASVLEQLERRERFSSFYAGPSALQRLEDIHALGLGSPEMERRLELIRTRIQRASQRQKA